MLLLNTARLGICRIRAVLIFSCNTFSKVSNYCNDASTKPHANCYVMLHKNNEREMDKSFHMTTIWQFSITILFTWMIFFKKSLKRKPWCMQLFWQITHVLGWWESMKEMSGGNKKNKKCKLLIVSRFAPVNLMPCASWDITHKLYYFKFLATALKILTSWNSLPVAANRRDNLNIHACISPKKVYLL